MVKSEERIVPSSLFLSLFPVEIYHPGHPKDGAYYCPRYSIHGYQIVMSLFDLTVSLTDAERLGKKVMPVMRSTSRMVLV